MNREEVLDLVEKKAFEAQVRDDLCSRSVMCGLASYFEFIPQSMIAASMSLAGGAGASSGSCGAYCSGLLAIGLRYNPTIAEEGVDRHSRLRGVRRFLQFRDIFLKEFGATLCPEIQRKLFGRSFVFTDERQHEEFFQIPDHAERCATVVAKAARLAAGVLLEGGDPE